MYLHRKHIHPSVLAVMERDGHKQVNVPASVRKTVSCKVIGESLVLEGYTPAGKKLVVEGDKIDPVLGGKPLLIPINESYSFVLNSDEEYEVMRVDEGLGDMITKAGAWLKGAWNGFMTKLKKFFSKPGEAEQFAKLLKSNPELAKKHLTERAIAMGKTPEQAATMFKQAQKAAVEADAKAAGIKNRDQEMINAMAGAADAKTPEEKAAAQQKLDRAHELAMAKAQKGQTVVAGGGAGAQGKPGPDGKPAAKTPAAPAAAPAPAADPAAAAAAPAPAPAAPAPAGPKEGDKVEKTDAAGKKLEGQVITVDEAGAKKWNDQFAGKAGFIGIKAGPVVKTASGFFPLDKEWQVAAAPDPAAAGAPTKPAPAADPKAAVPAPAPAPVAAAAQPEVKPVPTPDGETPTNVPPAAAPAKPADAGLTGAEQGPGPAATAPAPDQDPVTQPAAEPAFDPNATIAAPAQVKPGIPAGAKKSKIVNGKRVVGERLMTMAEIDRLLKGTK